MRCDLILGDVDDLKEKMEVLLEKELSKEEREETRKHIEEKYNPKLSRKRRTSRGRSQYDVAHLRGRQRAERGQLMVNRPNEIRNALTIVNFMG